MKVTKKIILILVAIMAMLTFSISIVEAAKANPPWLPTSGRKDYSR